MENKANEHKISFKQTLEENYRGVDVASDKEKKQFIWLYRFSIPSLVAALSCVVGLVLCVISLFTARFISVGGFAFSVVGVIFAKRGIYDKLGKYSYFANWILMVFSFVCIFLFLVAWFKASGYVA